MRGRRQEERTCGRWLPSMAAFLSSNEEKAMRLGAMGWEWYERIFLWCTIAGLEKVRLIRVYLVCIFKAVLFV